MISIAHRIGRGTGTPAQLPARTWTLALLFVTSAAGVAGMTVAPISGPAPVHLYALCAALLVIGAVGLIAAGRRIGDRGLLALAGVRIAIALVVAASARSSGATFFACGGFVWVAIWVTVFFSLRIQLLTLVAELVSVVVAAALNAHHLRTGIDATALLAGSVILSGLLAQVIRGLRRDAHHDHLTGLLNRYGVDQALHELGLRQRLGRTASLVAIDLDGLKEVNDRGGHLAGDRMLVTFATELSQAARFIDLPARVGGDEFIAILPGLSEAEAGLWADQLQERSCVAWSFGVAERDPDEGFASWLARADERMYAAKSARASTRSEPRRIPALA